MGNWGDFSAIQLQVGGGGGGGGGGVGGELSEMVLKLVPTSEATPSEEALSGVKLM